MATTLDWVKSVRADIRGDCGKGWNLRGREVGGKMVMQIDRNDENGRSTLLKILVGEKTIRKIY